MNDRRTDRRTILGSVAQDLRTRSHDGCLSPWAAPVTSAPGWQITTASRRLADTVTAIISGATVHPHRQGQWQARIPQPALMITVTGADSGALWCRLDIRPDSGVFDLVFAPWPAATVLRCPVTAWPAHGALSVRDVRVTTRMGRTVRYLIPVFTLS